MRKRDNKGRFMKGINNWTKEKQRISGRKSYQKHRIERLNKCKIKNRKDRLEVLQHYSNSKEPFCNCCGEKEIKFLAIDHINGGGSKFKKITGMGSSFCQWLRTNNYPEGFQILCHNCNMAKSMYGICPHKVKGVK